MSDLADAGPDLLRELERIIQWHDEHRECDLWKRGELYERGPRPKNDGQRYRFAMVGPEGCGFYRCWCNPARAAIDKAYGRKPRRRSA